MGQWAKMLLDNIASEREHLSDIVLTLQTI